MALKQSTRPARRAKKSSVQTPEAKPAKGSPEHIAELKRLVEVVDAAAVKLAYAKWRVLSELQSFGASPNPIAPKASASTDWVN